MFSQLFGRYLVNQSILNEDDYKIIIEKQLSVRVKLGTIAVAEGVLTEEQVEEINNLQRVLDKRFGDIAIEKKLLTPEQIDSLLQKQGNAYLQFVQLLTDMTDQTNSDIEKHLKDFQKETGISDEELEALKQDDVDKLVPIFVISSKPYVLELAGLALRNITRFVSRDFYIEKASHIKELSYTHFSCQELSGDATLFVGFAEEESSGAFLQIAEEFSREKMNYVNEDTYDAIGEFINVTNGIFASALSKKKINVDMEPPLGFEKQTIIGDFYSIPIYIEGRKINLIVSVNSDFSAGETPLKVGSLSKHKMLSQYTTDTKANILIVDDSKMSRSMLRNILEKANFNVIGEAANGLDGFKAYKEFAPDVVTLDITMPQMDGLEALRQILGYDSSAKVIMITAAGQQDKLIRALKDGAKRFISKPFNEDEIISNITEMLNE